MEMRAASGMALLSALALRPSPLQLQTGPGSLTRRGGRYGAAGAFPATADSGPLNRYLAGTFEFEAATPEPATCGFVGMGLAGLAFVSRRRKA